MIERRKTKLSSATIEGMITSHGNNLPSLETTGRFSGTEVFIGDQVKSSNSVNTPEQTVSLAENYTTVPIRLLNSHSFSSENLSTLSLILNESSTVIEGQKVKVSSATIEESTIPYSNHMHHSETSEPNIRTSFGVKSETSHDSNALLYSESTGILHGTHSASGLLKSSDSVNTIYASKAVSENGILTTMLHDSVTFESSVFENPSTSLSLRTKSLSTVEEQETVKSSVTATVEEATTPHESNASNNLPSSEEIGIFHGTGMSVGKQLKSSNSVNTFQTSEPLSLTDIHSSVLTRSDAFELIVCTILPTSLQNFKSESSSTVQNQETENNTATIEEMTIPHVSSNIFVSNATIQTSTSTFETSVGEISTTVNTSSLYSSSISHSENTGISLQRTSLERQMNGSDFLNTFNISETVFQDVIFSTEQPKSGTFDLMISENLTRFFTDSWKRNFICS